ncbi:MAG: YicC/YloC family endoribonuclease [Chlamydiota bacterium]
MALSMTAYGRAHTETSMGIFLIEIHSVNRKGLSIRINLPKEFLVLDLPLRLRLAEVVTRGYITVRIAREATDGAVLGIPPIELLKKLQVEWKTCARELGYDCQEAIPFSMIIRFAAEGLSSEKAIAIDETVKKEILKGLDAAIGPFMEMKRVEGDALVADLLPRLNAIEGAIERLKKLSTVAPERYRDRLVKKLEGLRIERETDEDRLNREIVLFADKIDVTEEITRLSSHVRQLKGLLKRDEQPVGRESDFLIQEANREVNTVAAKSQQLEMTRVVLGVKSELEKIREQLANIE